MHKIFVFIFMFMAIFSISALCQENNPDDVIFGTGSASQTEPTPPVAWHKAIICDSNIDIGEQIQPLLQKYQCILVKLAAKQAYMWDKPIVIHDFQILYIYGEGFENEAQNITVTINMIHNETFVRNNVSYREPARVTFRGAYNGFILEGVKVTETSNDMRPLTPRSDFSALFSFGGNSYYGFIAIRQSRLAITEDLVNLGGQAYGRVLYGWTFIDRYPSTSKTIMAVKAHYGWNFAGNGGVVSCSHTSLGEGVSYQSTPSIIYLK